MHLRSSVDFNTTNTVYLYLYVRGGLVCVVINSDTVSKQISERNCEDMVLDGHLYSTQVPIASMAASI